MYKAIFFRSPSIRLLVVSACTSRKKFAPLDQLTEADLDKVGQFTLLQDLFQHITIPPAVFEEVVIRGEGQPGAGETNTAQWITRGMLRRSDIADILAAELDRGEAEAIALALQEKANWLDR
jgi:predicted nucleic acid-binding protein